MKPTAWIKDKWRELKDKYWDVKSRYNPEAKAMEFDRPWLRTQWEERQKFKPAAKLALWGISAIAGALLVRTVGLG